MDKERTNYKSSYHNLQLENEDLKNKLYEMEKTQEIVNSHPWDITLSLSKGWESYQIRKYWHKPLIKIVKQNGFMNCSLINEFKYDFGDQNSFWKAWNECYSKFLELTKDFLNDNKTKKIEGE